MLTIQPIESKDNQRQLSLQCGTEYLPDCLAYSCSDGDEIIGICQFHLAGDRVYIDTLANIPGHDDYLSKFIMGRAALNFADLTGFHDAYYPSPEDERLCRHIGFDKNDAGEWYMNLRGFFTSPCSCDKKV